MTRASSPEPPIASARSPFGVIVDPNISQPLPFAGLSYVDFNLFGTGTQFNGVLWRQLRAAGVLGAVDRRVALAAGRARVRDRHRRTTIAPSSRGANSTTQDIRQRPAQAAVWALRPLGVTRRLRLEYDWDYTKFSRGDATDAAFVVPPTRTRTAARIGLDLQRAGWQASIWGSQPAGRLAAVGVSASAIRTPRTATSSATVRACSARRLIARVLAARIEAAWMGGQRSRSVQPLRVRHVRQPPARLSVGAGPLRSRRRAAHGARLDGGKSVRLDGFADTAARARSRHSARGLRNFTGFGAAVEAPAPFGSLLAIEWGFGLQGIDTDGRRGTHVLRISGYKVF